jgi:hypothetical protein
MRTCTEHGWTNRFVCDLSYAYTQLLRFEIGKKRTTGPGGEDPTQVNHVHLAAAIIWRLQGSVTRRHVTHARTYMRTKPKAERESHAGPPPLPMPAPSWGTVLRALKCKPHKLISISHHCEHFYIFGVGSHAAIRPLSAHRINQGTLKGPPP